MILYWITHHLISMISFVLTLVFVSFVLRERKPAGSTMAWLILIALIPYLGIPLYLFFSNRKFPTRLTRKTKLYQPDRFESTPPELSRTRRILISSGIPDAIPNQSITLLTTGVEAYTRLIALIRDARQSIHITTFILADDPVGRSIVAELIEKTKSGVEVRLLIDSLGAELIRHPSFRDLKDSGGKIAYFMPLFHFPSRGRTNLRNHRKIAIFDGKTAIVGGMNLAQEYMGPDVDPKRWIDLASEVMGGSVFELESLFLRDWAYATKQPKPESPKLESSIEFCGPLAQVVASGPDVVGDPLYDVLLTSIYAADHQIFICSPYFIPDESLTKALELAAKRKVEVHILTPSKSNHLLADIARGSYLRQLEASGAHLHLHSNMIHAKAIVIDRSFALLGSINFDMRSLLLNYELGILIYDELTIDAIEKWSAPMMSESRHTLPARNIWRDMIEGIGRAIGPIL